MNNAINGEVEKRLIEVLDRAFIYHGRGFDKDLEDLKAIVADAQAAAVKEYRNRLYNDIGGHHEKVGKVYGSNTYDHGYHEATEQAQKAVNRVGNEILARYATGEGRE